MTNALGFQSETATNGRQLFAAATESPDTELILVSARINHPTAVEVVQQLREDPRTADVPICVMAELDERGFAEQAMAKLPGVFVETRPPSLDAMKRIAARAASMAEIASCPPKLRQQEAVAALDWLAELAVLPPEIANVRRYEPTIERALYSPLTATHAAAVLARLPRRRRSGRWSIWPASACNRCPCVKPRRRPFAKASANSACVLAHRKSSVNTIATTKAPSKTKRRSSCSARCWM